MWYAYVARLAHHGQLGLGRRQLRGEKVVEDRGLCAAGRLRLAELRDGAPVSRASQSEMASQNRAKTAPRLIGRGWPEPGAARGIRWR